MSKGYLDRPPIVDPKDPGGEKAAKKKILDAYDAEVAAYEKRLKKATIRDGVLRAPAGTKVYQKQGWIKGK